jgi:basic membrane protein A
MDRRTFIRATGIAGIAGLAGCTGGPQEGGETTEETTESGGGGDGGDMETTTEEQATTESGPAANIGMVYALGGLGDGSFNDQAQTGAQQAEEELGISFNDFQPSQSSEFETFQRRAATSTDPNYDLVCCIGFAQQSTLQDTAPQFTDQDFMIVDAVVDQPNVDSYVFAEEEGSYLVGQLAGLMTSRSFSAGAGSTQSDSTNVGFVGGAEVPIIEKFEAGYTAGVKAANADVDVITNYVGGFNDPAGGREAALSMYNSGADVIYHASGNTGTGVFQAAQDQGRYAIGVDADQSVTKSGFADVILASMVKRVDTAVFNSIESVVNGNFSSGVTALGLADDGVGIVYGQQLGDSIPSEVRSEIDTARQSIIDGDIDVPTDPGNVSN